MAAAKKPSPSALAKAFKVDLAAAWQRERSRRPEETPYAFVLYGLEDTPHLTIHLLTEEALTRAAQYYVKTGPCDTTDEARKKLRYSVADVSVFTGDEELPAVSALFAPFAESLGETKGYALLASAAKKAFKALDAEHLFGVGEERSKLILLFNTNDTSKDLTATSAKALNPADVYQRYRQATSVKGSFANTCSIAASPDGQTLYTVGSIKNPRYMKGSESEFISEVNSLRIGPSQPVPKWTYTFGDHGDSARRVVALPDGSAVVLGVRYAGGDVDPVLLKFAKDGAAPIAEALFSGEMATLAASNDGSCFALATFRGKIFILDANFRLVNQVVVEAQLMTLLYLRDNRLLIGTDKALFQLAPGDSSPSILLQQIAQCVSIDESEKRIALAEWFNLGHETKEIFVRMFDWPSLTPLNQIGLRGYSNSAPKLSPDGRLLVCSSVRRVWNRLDKEANEMRDYQVAFDALTGEELGRKRGSPYPNEGVFIGDRIIAIPFAGITERQRVEIWRID